MQVQPSGLRLLHELTNQSIASCERGLRSVCVRTIDAALVPSGSNGGWTFDSIMAERVGVPHLHQLEYLDVATDPCAQLHIAISGSQIRTEGRCRSIGSRPKGAHASG